MQKTLAVTYIGGTNNAQAKRKSTQKLLLHGTLTTTDHTTARVPTVQALGFLETRTTTRRGRTRQEFLAKWPGELQAQWISLEQLRTSLPHDELPSILGPEGS